MSKCKGQSEEGIEGEGERGFRIECVRAGWRWVWIDETKSERTVLKRWLV